MFAEAEAMLWGFSAGLPSSVANSRHHYVGLGIKSPQSAAGKGRRLVFILTPKGQAFYHSERGPSWAARRALGRGWPPLEMGAGVGGLSGSGLTVGQQRAGHRIGPQHRSLAPGRL